MQKKPNFSREMWLDHALISIVFDIFDILLLTQQRDRKLRSFGPPSSASASDQEDWTTAEIDEIFASDNIADELDVDCYPEQLAPGSASATAGATAHADAEDVFMETPQMQTQKTPRFGKASLLSASAANAAAGAAADADAEDAFMETPQM